MFLHVILEVEVISTSYREHIYIYSFMLWLIGLTVAWVGSQLFGFKNTEFHNFPEFTHGIKW